MKIIASKPLTFHIPNVSGKQKKNRNMTIESAITKKVVGTIYDDIVKYYGLYGFIKYKIKALNNKPIHISSNEDFWSLILQKQFVGDYDNGRTLLTGQPLTFSNRFYLSEWAPKIPGKLWTKSGRKSFNEAYGNQIEDNNWEWSKRYELIFDEFGKRRAMEAGYGSVRINPSNNPNETFMYMSLTTVDHWEVDYGIPIIVSKRVFEEYRKKSVRKGAVEIGKLEGILIVDLDLPLNDIITKAIGAEIDQKSIDLLTKQPFLPKCFVYVPSTLGIDFKYNDSHPECTGWTMYKKNFKNNSWRTNYNQDANVEFGLTYSHFNPTQSESINEAIAFMKDYAEYNDGTELITDFDGMEPKLESRLKLNENPKNAQTEIFKYTLEEMNAWVKSIKWRNASR